MVIDRLRAAAEEAENLSHEFQRIRIIVESDGFLVRGDHSKKDVSFEVPVPWSRFDAMTNPILLAVQEVDAVLRHSRP